MNTNTEVSQNPPAKPRAFRPWFLLIVLGVAAFVAWWAWPRASDVSVLDFSRADGKPRFWATSYPKTDFSNLTLWQRLYITWIDYRRRHATPNPAAYTFPPGQAQPCSIAGLLNQCMKISGTRYLIAVEASGGIVNFGHTNKLNGAQWVSAFEQALTNQPVGCYDYAEKRGFIDTLLLVREQPDLVKIVPRSMLSVYEKAGLVKANSVEGSGK